MIVWSLGGALASVALVCVPVRSWSIQTVYFIQLFFTAFALVLPWWPLRQIDRQIFLGGQFCPVGVGMRIHVGMRSSRSVRKYE